MRGLFHIFQGDRFLLGLANTAINRVIDDQSFVFALPGAINVQNEGHFFGVGFADSATAELTHRMSRTFTMPAFHRASLYIKLAVCKCTSLQPEWLQRFSGYAGFCYSVKCKSLVAKRSAASIKRMVA